MSITICDCGVCPSCLAAVQPESVQLMTLGVANRFLETAREALANYEAEHERELEQLRRNYERLNGIGQQFISQLELTLAINDSDTIIAPRSIFANTSTTTGSALACAIATLDGHGYPLSMIEGFASMHLGFVNIRALARMRIESPLSDMHIVDIRGQKMIVEMLRYNDAVWVSIDFVQQKVLSYMPIARGCMMMLSGVDYSDVVLTAVPRHFPGHIYSSNVVRRGRFCIKIEGESALVCDSITPAVTRVWFLKNNFTLHNSVDYQVRGYQEYLVFRGQDRDGIKRFEVNYADLVS